MIGTSCILQPVNALNFTLKSFKRNHIAAFCSNSSVDSETGQVSWTCSISPGSGNLVVVAWI
jgi:hypothetical protein